MAQKAIAEQAVSLEVENIGGIDRSTVEFSPGVTVLTGRNATNRTSLLQAIIAALGGDSATVKGDAEQGHVELTIGDRTYSRTLTRTDGTVVTDGDPYLEDPTLGELFAFLLESNEARQAVARGEDLYDVIMRPVDTAEIESRIDDLQTERERYDEQLEELDSLKRRLPDLEAERKQLREDLDERRDELSDIEAAIADAEQDIDQKKEAQQEIEERIQELNDRRSELETTRRKIDSQRESLHALRDERDDLEADLEDYEEVSEGQIDGTRDEIQRLRQQKSQIESSVDELQTIIQFNNDLLDGTLDIFTELRDDDDEPISNRLVDDSDDLVCWTCGNDVDTDQIESMVETLGELRDRKMERRSDLDEQIEDLNDKRRRLEEKQRQRNQITDQLDAVRDEIEDRETRLDDLQTREESLADEVEQLEAEVDTLQEETQQNSELLDRHKEANRMRVEIETLESDLEDTTNEIVQVEERLSRRDELEEKRSDVQSSIEELRTRVDRLEEDAVSQFNEHMAQVLDVLEYENFERIWIERTEDEVRRGRRKTNETRFDLHVVRSTDSGTVYEDVIDHLSESEREVTGLVFALAGYLVHDVYEQVPVMLLDSMEAIDAPRLARLVEYFDEYTDYLVVALLEEDAQALSDGYERISEI
jgi:predicted  nucleic acid-binding Zn-ribbon protein